MAAKILCAVVLCVIVLQARAATKIGSFITPCSLKDPQLDSCILTQAKAIWPKIVGGVRDWGLRSLDPITVTQMDLSEGGNNAVNLQLGGTNITFTGYKDIEILSAKADPENLRFGFTITVPDFAGSGQYYMDGRLLLLPITGRGDFNFHYMQERFEITFDFKRTEQGKKQIMKLENVIVNIIEIKKVTHYYDNLFGNKELSDNMNQVLNDNGQEIIRELKGRIESTIANMILALFKPMFNKIPITDLFKDAN